MTRFRVSGGTVAQSGSAGRSLFRYIWKIRSARRGVPACHWTMCWLPMMVTDVRVSRAEYGWFAAGEIPLDSAFRASAAYRAALAWADHATQTTARGVAALLAGARTPTATATGCRPPRSPPALTCAATTSPRQPASALTRGSLARVEPGGEPILLRS